MPDDLSSLKARLDQLESELLRVTRSNTALEDQQAIMARQAMFRQNSLDIKDMVDTFTTDLKLYKNMVYNSSFEAPGANQTPTYWTGGTATADAAWYDTYSLRISAGLYAEQTSTAWITPEYYGGGKTRVSFWHKFARLRCEVLNDEGHVLATHDYGWAADWPDGRRTFTFDPGESAQIYLKFTNLETVAGTYAYLDAVQLEPDLNGRMPSLYTDGPYSAGGTGSSFFDTAGVAVAEFGTLIPVAPAAQTMPTLTVAYAGGAASLVQDGIYSSGSGAIVDWAPAYFVGRSSVRTSLNGAEPAECTLYQVIVPEDYEPAMPVDGAVLLLFDTADLQLDVHAPGQMAATDAPDLLNTLLTQLAPWDQTDYFASLSGAFDSSLTYSATITTGSGASVTTITVGVTATGTNAVVNADYVALSITTSVGGASASTVAAGATASGTQNLTALAFSSVVITTGTPTTTLTLSPPVTDGDSTGLTTAAYVPSSTISTAAVTLVA